MTNFSLWIVAAFLVAEEVALYGAAWRLVNLVILPLMLMNMSVQPVIAELYAITHKRRLQNALRGSATLAGIPALGILVLFIVFGSDILGFVYGKAYRDAAMILVILSVGQIINVWTGSCGQVLALTGHQRALMYITIVTAIISLALAIIAVKFWGLLGVAAATSGGRVLQNALTWISTRKLTGLWTHGTFSPAFIKYSAKQVLCLERK
jgi:O-antigen/teichoic acid export membrane protein